jgi:hypothetical protein
MEANVVTGRAQGSNVIPVHPARLNIFFCIPPGNMFSTDPPRCHEKAGALAVSLENRRRHGRVSTIPVVEGDRELASEVLALAEPPQQVIQRNDVEEATEKAYKRFELPVRDGKYIGAIGVVDAMEEDYDRLIAA